MDWGTPIIVDIDWGTPIIVDIDWEHQ